MWITTNAILRSSSPQWKIPIRAMMRISLVQPKNKPKKKIFFSKTTDNGAQREAGLASKVSPCK